MIENNYIEVPSEWADQKDGTYKNPNVFMSVTTLSGKRVVSANSCNEFPELFEELKATGWQPVFLTLNTEDFILPSEL